MSISLKADAMLFNCWCQQGAGYEAQVARGFVEGHCVMPILPGGGSDAPELVRLLKNRTEEGRDQFRRCVRELLQQDETLEARRKWGLDELEPGQIAPRASQMSLMFLRRKAPWSS